MQESAQSRYAARRAVKASDISPIPSVVDPARRENCRNSLQLFLETYFPAAFPGEWSPDHLDVIAKTEAAIRDGGYFAIGMPRGSGKTTITIRSAIWAIVYGHCRYVYLVAADAGKAKNMLKSIKTEIEFNPLLFQDHPHACYPVRCLQGAPAAAKKQHVAGEPTNLDWTADVAQFATVAGSECSGSRIGVGGVTGASRGAQVTLPSGEVLRPELILIDDFQTRESAASVTQTATRLATITADLGGMRPPGGKLAILATVTVIYRDDAADKLLDRKLYPEWHGVRKKMLYSWPTDVAKWEEYMELRRQAFTRDEKPTAATDYYRANFDAMNAGAHVGWEARKTDEELSALQHAFNLLCDQGEEAFQSEYQNEPIALDEEAFGFLRVEQIAEKLDNRKQSDVPAAAQKIVAAVDVQKESLWWAVVAWGEGMTGWVLDYGCYPEQKRSFFSKRDLPKPLSSVYPGLNEDQAIFQGLTDLVEKLAGRVYKLSDGSEHLLDRLVIDEGYKPATVHLFCRQSKNPAIMPVKGFGIKAGRQPMHEWPIKKGERYGTNWRVRQTTQDRMVRHFLVDANHWKTFVHQRLATPFGGDGSLSFWGDKPLRHRLIAQHLGASETPIATEGQGRKLIEWEIKPTRPDNEWFDTLSYCAAAGYEQGLTLLGDGPPRKAKTRKSKHKTLAERRLERRLRAGAAK